MPPLTQLAHEALRPVVRPGDIVVDATAGNGHDTCFLAQLVGLKGRVWAFDNQAAAVERTQHRVLEHHLTQVTLCLADHGDIRQLIPVDEYGHVAAIMWNLGYLPGGDKRHVTQKGSTLRSLEEGLPLLRVGGRATLLAYPGHPGGIEEAAAVAQFLQSLPENQYRVEIVTGPPGLGPSPRLFLIEKREQPR